MSAMQDDPTLVCQYNLEKVPTGIYLRTKHGTISPFSILLSHDEHTPWWIDPAPSEKDDCQARVYLFLFTSYGHKPEFQSKGPILSLSYSTEIAIIQPKYTIKPTCKCKLYV